MVALTVESAKTIGLTVAIGLAVLAVGSAWLIKNITQKLISVAVLGILAIGIWTQRTNLSDCANTAKERVKVGDTSNVTCTFFGSEVDLSKQLSGR
jgi:hypothetical protein